MCSIIDTNVFGEAFGDNSTDAGDFFYRWLSSHGYLIVGGSKMLQELGLKSTRLKERYRVLRAAGRIKQVPNATVDAKAEELEAQGGWQSDDWHILALTLLHEQGVHILYSYDRALHQDFKRIRRFGTLKASIYSSSFHKKLLTRNLCA